MLNPGLGPPTQLLELVQIQAILATSLGILIVCALQFTMPAF